MTLFNENQNLILAIITGIVPALIWLWFWLRQDREKPEPGWLLFLCFITGMLSTFFAIPLEKLAQKLIFNEQIQIIAWASIEEIIKYGAVVFILNIKKFIRDPIDWAIYLITVALGFAAMENVMFLTNSVNLEKATVNLITGQLRFIGSTLLHAISSGIIGIAIGLAFFKKTIIKKIYLWWGILLSIGLHSAFNFLIIRKDGSDYLRVFAFLWIVTIIVLLIFEKLRRMSINN